AMLPVKAGSAARKYATEEPTTPPPIITTSKLRDMLINRVSPLWRRLDVRAADLHPRHGFL
ncbi:MAG TPA: hypothetical protein VG742_19530, partial [Dongiaceae bacterium]|nr:hypothetical protein [Dongiaceae bacterium]